MVSHSRRRRPDDTLVMGMLRRHGQERRSAWIRMIPDFMASCSLIAPSADGLIRTRGDVHHS